MYRSSSLWDQEQDKYDSAIREITGQYHGDEKYSGKEGDYTSGDKQDDYIKKEDKDGKKEDKSEFEEKVDSNLPHKKYDKKDGGNSEVRTQVAKEINQGIQEEQKKPGKKSSKSIEDAIKKAIEEEKEVIRP